jgi:hypothetical protein
MWKRPTFKKERKIGKEEEEAKKRDRKGGRAMPFSLLE